MSPTIRIDVATPADRDAFLALNRTVQDLHVAAHPELFKSSSEVVLSPSWFDDLLARPGTVVWLARGGGSQPLGYLYAERQSRPETPFRYALRVLYLHHLAVQPDARGQGIGSALVRHALDDARAHGIPRAELDVWTFNDHARRIFEHFKFRSFNDKLWRPC